MNAIKSLNKEQWTALAAVGLGGLLLFTAGGGGAPASVPALSPDRAYEPGPQRSAELPDEKFERYWQGRDIFKADAAAKLAVPRLKAPEPREEDLPAPAFRPGPAWEVYNGLAVPAKYPVLSPGQPVIAEANLPPPAEVEALRKTEEPPAAARKDRRDEREREFLVIQLNTGAKFEGKELMLETPTEYHVRDKNGQRLPPFKKADVRSFLPNRTFQEEFKVRSARIAPGPKEADERVKLAHLGLEWGMLPEAREEARAAHEAKKDHLEATLLLGQLAQESADFEGAMATYQAAMDAGAPAADLHYEIGRCLRALAFHEGALAAFEKAVEAQPRLGKARVALARAQLDAGSAKAAAEAASDFLQRLGGLQDTPPALKSEAFALRGIAMLREGQLEKARGDLGEALKIDPSNAEASNALGSLHAVEGKYPQAAPEFVKAIRAQPYLTEAWTNLATLFLLGGKWAEAEALFGAALQRDPASVEAALGIGIAQFLAGKKEAPQSLERAAAMDPRDLAVQIVSGHLKLREGADEEALARFTDALRAEFHYLPAYSGAAAAYLRAARKMASDGAEGTARRVQELRVSAETLIRALRDFDPNRASYWALLGSCYAVTGRSEEARQALRMAQTLASQSQKPVDPFVLYTAGYLEYHHGQAESDKERLELAQREFQQGLKLKGQFIDPYSIRVIADCEAANEAIEAWKTTDVRIDERFDGETVKSIGGGWIEADDRNGIAITRESSKERGGRAKFAGTQVGRDWGLTTLSKDIPGQGFSSLEITFQPVKTDKTEYGVSILTSEQGGSWAGFHLGLDAAGKLRYLPHGSDREMDGRDMSVGWVDVKAQAPNPAEITVRLSVVEKGRATSLAISFWDPARGEWIATPASVPVNLGGAGKGNWRVSAWVRAWKGQDVQLYVDNFRVFERSRR